MKPAPPQPGEKHGLHCPKCGADLEPRMIAKSYKSPAGQFRTRCCRGCGAEIETVETVVGSVTDFIDVSGLGRAQLLIVRQMLAEFRRQAVTIDMASMTPARTGQLRIGGASQ